MVLNVLKLQKDIYEIYTKTVMTAKFQASTALSSETSRKTSVLNVGINIWLRIGTGGGHL